MSAAEFWVQGTLVRYSEPCGEWQVLDGVTWTTANDWQRRSISAHLDEHCAGDGWPSHEADRSLPHATLGEALGLVEPS